jgi:hypothetical protein
MTTHLLVRESFFYELNPRFDYVGIFCLHFLALRRILQEFHFLPASKVGLIKML